MLLKSIKLENIRSYTYQKIEFPTGSVLLAGDIGSGKSTILLAIEFALFGIKPGELVGSALLRHGCKQGSVELCFSISNKEVIVKRELKRGKDRIGQSAGYIIIDQVKQELMPKEIRVKIFELLDYPQSLVSKGQDLIYRFTVYTPQDDMKRIIYENKDIRLDTLRKVFNIDRYKRIRENVVIYIKSIKEKRSNYEGRIADLEEKKKRKEEIKSELKIFNEKEQEVKILLERAREKSAGQKKELEALESQITEFHEKRKELALLELDLKNVLENRESDKREIAELQRSIIGLREELKDFRDELDLKGVYEEKERRIHTLEKEIIISRNEKSEIKGKASHINQSADNILRLDSCPLCLQDVAHEHKERIMNKTHKEVNELNEMLEVLEKKESDLVSNLDSLKKESKELHERIVSRKLQLLKKQNLIEKEKRLQLFLGMLEESKKKIAEINSKKIDINRKVQLFGELESKYTEAKKMHESLQAEERKAELEKNSLSKQAEMHEKQLAALEKEILEKEEIKKKLKRLVSLQNWLSDKFIKLVNNIEKHVMLAIYHEFNELFQRWFTMLIEDENLNVRLDDSFSVIVEQNGYETTVENLSGGEKTSVALAYRLALNKVINDVVSQIKTKDLLILDEPTEGFSANQLDKVRDVLDQIGIRQIIIVSHESKIESYVDNVIRIGKSEGVSSTQ